MNVVPKGLFYRRESQERREDSHISLVNEPACEISNTSKLAILNSKYASFTVSVNEKA